MNTGDLDWITNFIWGIADDVLRDVYVRGKYRDVILPMTVLRRLDTVLEPVKDNVRAMKAQLDAAEVIEQDAALRQAAGQAFYNTSPFTLRDLRNRASQAQLKDDFEAYLDGFSPNVQEILDSFEFRNQVPKLSRADRIGSLIEKFLDPQLNLGPNPVLHGDGSVKLPALDNHGMGTIFEALVRKFNEDNNEEAGEHWTPRDAVKLMAELIFRPVAEQIASGTYLLYDGACGTGGMLTVAEETLERIAREHGKKVSTHLFGQEINPETYAIAKADLILKGEGEEADNIVGGPEWSTLSNDAFPSREFDFMLSNPPYGKSYKTDLERMGGKGEVKDPRFIISHGGDDEYSLMTRSSDGQMLFLANLVSKIKHKTALGSRIASVHNGSSLFTGDAGSGESNTRRWIIENDWLEAIIALPLNMFFNTGIATYVWVLTNRKPVHRRGQVQLIDGTGWSDPLRKNMGKKNCQLTPDHIERIVQTFLAFEPGEQSRVFPNAEFGYWKVTVERPLRLVSELKPSAIETLRFASGDAAIRQKLYAEFGDDLSENYRAVAKALEARLGDWGQRQAADDDEEDAPKPKGLPEKKRAKLLNPKLWARDARLVELGYLLRDKIGSQTFSDFNVFKAKAESVLKKEGVKLGAGDMKSLLRGVSRADPAAAPVIKKVHKGGQADPIHGLFAAKLGGKPVVVEYEPDTALRDTESVPFVEAGGIEAFIQREVLPYAPDAWIDAEKTQIGYEISFTRVFYKPQPLRTLEQIRAEIVALEQETDGLLPSIIGVGA
jgi:type I restriction enzyme M protein